MIRKPVSGTRRWTVAALVVGAVVIFSGTAVLAACPPPGAYPLGMDVSSFDGVIDWAQAATCVHFAYARVSDGTSLDSKFVANQVGASAANVPFGAYQFFQPAQDPVAQADIVIGVVHAGDLRPAVDVEISGGQPPATVAMRLRTWVDLVKQAIGVDPVIYTSTGLWNTIVADASFTSNPLWIALYGAGPPAPPEAN
jgi:lysozyme